MMKKAESNRREYATPHVEILELETRPVLNGVSATGGVADEISYDGPDDEGLYGD